MRHRRYHLSSRAYSRMHWARVLRCVQEGPAEMPNGHKGLEMGHYGDKESFIVEDDIHKIETILISLYEMGAITHKEFYPGKGDSVDNLRARIRRRLKKMLETGIVRPEGRNP
jgi:hypothetical protein